jgi:hypothetical protein
MKKVFLFMALFVIAQVTIVNAQIQQGNVMVGGSLSNISLGLDDSKVFSLDLTPKAAWFIRDNIALGGYANLGIQTAKNTSTTVNYGLGALGRYYSGADMEVVKHGRFFGEGTLGLGGINVSNGGGHTNGVDFSFGPGFAYFITPNIGLETLLKYNGVGGFGNAGYQSTLGLSFGFQIYLPGKRTLDKIKNDVK